MSQRDDLLGMLSGRKPERIPFIFMGFQDEKAIRKFAPEDCHDENTYYIPSDNPPRDGFSDRPRTQESRERAVRMSEYVQMATVGVGKGGVFPFGHGGPGEIQPKVIERTPEYKILGYEGGHKRRINYNPHSIRYYDFPLQTEANLDRLELPDMRDPARYADVEADAALIKGSGFVPTGNIQGFFSGVHNSFRDYEEAMVALLASPEFTRRVTEVLARMGLAAVDMLMDRGVEIINVCDDFGNAGGLIISPELIRAFFMPWYAELADLVHKKGGYLHLHSHGNIREILPDLASIGVDIINPFDWEENPDLPELVKLHAKDFVFCGGTAGAMYQHDFEEVAAIVKRACALSEHAEKGYILLMGGPLETQPRETWDAWMDIISRGREGEL